MSKFWPKLILCVVVVMVLGAAGGLATAGSIPGWYAALAKPPGTPPNAIFGPVWTVLYTMMAVAAWLVWRRRAEGTRPALTAYALQLVLNLLWTPVFFGLYLWLVDMGLNRIVSWILRTLGA